jgi:hypothetical protein
MLPLSPAILVGRSPARVGHVLASYLFPLDPHRWMPSHVFTFDGWWLQCIIPNNAVLEPVSGVGAVKANSSRKCQVCSVKKGSCLVCSVAKCGYCAHPTCALDANLLIVRRSLPETVAAGFVLSHTFA